MQSESAKNKEKPKKGFITFFFLTKKNKISLLKTEFYLRIRFLIQFVDFTAYSVESNITENMFLFSGCSLFRTFSLLKKSSFLIINFIKCKVN